MPYTREHKARTHERIVSEAARAFRVEGLDGVAVGEVMGRVGLTHGGFYAHFPSKDALVAAACARSMDEQGERLTAKARKAPDGDGLRAIIEAYLDARHRDAPGAGCTIPALAAEIARASDEVRDAFTSAFTGYVSRIEPFLPATLDGAATEQQDRVDTALVLLAELAGAILLARAVSDPALSDRILAAARTFSLRAFADNTATTARSADQLAE
ncbi:MAG: TetR/AcrR family transcriptional regulator [Ktedonobacterales bacterium]